MLSKGVERRGLKAGIRSTSRLCLNYVNYIFIMNAHHAILRVYYTFYYANCDQALDEVTPRPTLDLWPTDSNNPNKQDISVV